MAYLSSAKRARIQRRIAALEAALTAAYDTLLAVSSSGEESFALDTGEASQKLKNVDISKLNKTILDMETTLEHEYDALNMRGIVRLNLRRKHGGVR